jgi:hypothetical protein
VVVRQLCSDRRSDGAAGDVGASHTEIVDDLGVGGVTPDADR